MPIKLVTLFPRPCVYTYTRPEFAHAMHAAIPWYYVRFLVTKPNRIIDALTSPLPHYAGVIEGQPPPMP